jgi:endonuclease/exonuclease/phosphatase family metal-dependent hydrolase
MQLIVATAKQWSVFLFIIYQIFSANLYGEQRKQSSHTVSMISANAFHLPGPLSWFNKNHFRRAQQLPFLKQHPIILLQEVMEPSTHKWLKEQLSSQYPHILDTLSTQQWNRWPSGLMIFSQFPILKSSLHIFKSFSSSEQFFPKGLLMASLLIATSPSSLHSPETSPKKHFLHLVVTHLDPSQQSIRIKQLQEIKEKADLFFKGEPYLIFGDFNFTPRDHEHDYFQQLGFHDLTTGIEQFWTYNSEENPLCWIQGKKQIDYIWSSATDDFRAHKRPLIKNIQLLKWKDFDGKFLSDHYGITSILLFD